MVEERALCPMSPAGHGDSFPCHIFLNSPCHPQSFPNPVWPVPPQISLQLCLTSSESSVTEVSVSRDKCELSPLGEKPWPLGGPASLHWAMGGAVWLLSAMACMDIPAGGRFLVPPASLLAPTYSVVPFSFFLISCYPEASIFTWLSKPFAFKNTY